MVTFDAQFLNIPIRALNVNGSIYPIVVREATFTRGFNSHDTVDLSLLLNGNITFDGKVRVPIDQDIPSGATQDVDIQTLNRQPVSFVYGVSPFTDQFVGYVTSVVPDKKFKENLNFQLQLTGASVVLQRVIRRFDTLKTTERAIADRVNLSSLGFYSDINATYEWPSLAQTSETDWQFIVGIARASGYIVSTWGSIVRVHKPIDLFKRYPYTSLVTSDDVLESDRKLMDFKPVEDSSALLDQQGAECFYFDSNDKVVTARQTLTGNNPIWRPITAVPVENASMATMLLDASANSIDRWGQTATARVRGDASIYPGMVVNVISGTNAPEFNGRWLVAGVKHSMDKTAFMTELTMARNTSIPYYSEAAFQHFWQQGGRGRPGVALRDGQWFSSWTDPSVKMVTV